MDAAKVLKHLEARIAQRKLYTYKPYGHPDTLSDLWSCKPWQINFHKAGNNNQERMIIAANRVGKTVSGGVEVAYHMTGDYPDWWEGKRFDRPVLVWTGSPTNETSRDIVQKALLGGSSPSQLGTGFIPKEKIVGKPKSRQAGISGVADSCDVRHISCGVSQVVFKTYEQGWRKFQGTEPEVVWLDEEPEDTDAQGRIYTECLTRLLTSHGILMVTFTPLLGQTTLVRHFQEGGEGIYMDTATWEDAPHLDRKERDRLKSSYPDHEVDARTKGVPMMGEGAVFLVPEEDIRIAPFSIPSHFARIKGIDFGIDHPAALADIAWDRDKDIIYVTRTWKKKNAESEEHAEAINMKNSWIPVAWPHDGANREKGSGQRLKDNYSKHGVKLLGQSARYKNDKGGSQAVEPIVQEIQERCRNGGFRVFADCTEFFDEYRNYYRKNGQLRKTMDDVLKSVFYAVMMRRYAKTNHVFHARTNMPAPLRIGH